MDLQIIEIARKWGTKKLPLKRVYHRIRDRELFLTAYGKLYANNGATTPGTDPKDTVDGMSLKRIDNLLEKLKTGTYHWQPVRRSYIEKKNSSKKRPLSLPGWNDKLLQEVIRMILEAYYEPQFSDRSHGFRPGRGCHTALAAIRNHWTGTKWFIEGDIKGCFENIDHTLLLDILKKDFPDQYFIKLLKGMLEAGYLEEWVYHQTYSGVPQGGVISPILSNIFLHQLDKFVEEELIPRYTRGQKRKKNREYHRVEWQMIKAKEAKDIKTYRQLRHQLRQMPCLDPQDEAYRRLHYVRYADDFLLGFTGPKEEAVQIKQEIATFLKTIGLTLSEEKTLITHAATEAARFLGYEVCVAHNNSKITEDKFSFNDHKKKRRAVNGKIVLNVPQAVTQEWVRRFTRNGKPVHRPALLNNSDYEIVMTYNTEFRGLVNYYLMAVNVAKRMYPIKYAYMQSLVKTLAAKHKQKATWVYCNYKRTFENGLTGIEVVVARETPKKPLVAKFGATPIHYTRYTVIKDQKSQVYNVGRTELVRRLLAEQCELCGTTEQTDQIEVHHVRKLASIRKQFQGKSQPPAWANFMMTRNRKTIVVCRQCHTAIHKGEYDGKKLA